MREVVLSAATLAGLVGLACLYSNGSPRVRREADFTAINDDGLEEYEVMDIAQDDNLSDYEFMKQLGLFEDDSDMPQILQEDIAMFQNGPKTGNTRKSIQFITKCMKNNACADRAEATVKKWGTNYRVWMEEHTEFALPISDELIADVAAPLGVCSPRGGVWPCSFPVDDAFIAYNPQRELTGDLQLMQQIMDTQLESSALNQTLAAMNVASPDDRNNIFGSDEVGRGARFVLIIPNGISVGMRADVANDQFRNYWGFFLHLNSKYIGIEKKKNRIGRDNIAFWFIRQDAEPKAIQKAPVKASSKFPWKRFDNLMTKTQNTAVQPNLKKTFKLLNDNLSGKQKNAKSRGLDCFVLWFHQYLPQDVAELTDVNSQENLVFPMDSSCTIIHFWVGMEAIFDDQHTRVVVDYLQGILQPTQKQKTSTDANMRGWFHVQDLASLADTRIMHNLSAKVYNIWMVERFRVQCLLSVDSANVVEAIESALELAKQEDYAYDEYYMSTTTTTAMEIANTTEHILSSDPPYSWNTTVWTTSAAQAESAPDYACCGVGFLGEKYDTNRKRCCPNGALVAVDDLC